MRALCQIINKAAHLAKKLEMQMLNHLKHRTTRTTPKNRKFSSKYNILETFNLQTPSRFIQLQIHAREFLNVTLVINNSNLRKTVVTYLPGAVHFRKHVGVRSPTPYFNVGNFLLSVKDGETP